MCVRVRELEHVHVHARRSRWSSCCSGGFDAEPLLTCSTRKLGRKEGDERGEFHSATPFMGT